MERTDKKLFNIEAEQMVLGVIILNNDYLGKVQEILLPDYFYEPIHQAIYDYIVSTTLRSNIVADSITLKLFFDNDDSIKRVGGSNYLTTLIKYGAGIIDIVDYANIIKDLAIKRQLVLIGEGIVSSTYQESSKLNATKLLEDIESSLFNLSVKGDVGKGFLGIGSSLADTTKQIQLAIERDGNISGITSGFIDLDNILGGFQNSDLIIVAGRPGMGKSALAINFSYNMAKELAKENKSVGFFSLEMPANQIAARILSMETGISTKKFRTGEVYPEDYDKVIQRAAEISKLPLFIDDTPALTIASIRTRTRRMIRQKNLGALVLDYLQLAHGTTRQSSESRVLEIGEITMGLKAIAKEFNIPIIALSQLSRSVEKRGEQKDGSKKPHLSDLRDSGNIEQDADIVMFIYREEYYLQLEKPSDSDSDKMHIWQAKMDKVRHKAEIMIAKHRNGPTGDMMLHFADELGRFSDYAGQYDKEDGTPY